MNAQNDPNKDPIDIELDRIKKAVKELSEHFDTVQILCTNHPSDEEGTTKYSWSHGNFYARLGHMLSWIEQEKGELYEKGARSLDNE